MQRVLVVYFSLSGHTRQVAEAIAARLDGQIDPIVDAAGRAATPMDVLWYAFEALLHQLPDIKDSAFLPDDFDLVVIGTPVWAAHMAPPVKAYLERHKGQFKSVALFCTEGGANGDKALARMAEITGQTPRARLIVTDEEIANGAYRNKVEAFASALKTPATAAG